MSTELIKRIYDSLVSFVDNSGAISSRQGVSRTYIDPDTVNLKDVIKGLERRCLPGRFVVLENSKRVVYSTEPDVRVVFGLYTTSRRDTAIEFRKYGYRRWCTLIQAFSEACKCFNNGTLGTMTTVVRTQPMDMSPLSDYLCSMVCSLTDRELEDLWFIGAGSDRLTPLRVDRTDTSFVSLIVTLEDRLLREDIVDGPSLNRRYQGHYTCKILSNSPKECSVILDKVAIGESSGVQDGCLKLGDALYEAHDLDGDSHDSSKCSHLNLILEMLSMLNSGDPPQETVDKLKVVIMKGLLGDR